MPLRPILHKITNQHWIALIILLLTVSGCTVLLQQTNSTPSTPQQDTVELLIQEAAQAQQLEPPEREQRLIDISERLLTISELAKAKKLISPISSHSLDDASYIRYIIIASRIHITDHSLFKAGELLNEPRLENLLDQLTIDQQKQLHQSKAELYNQTGNILDSLNERIILGTLLSETDATSNNNNAIWQQLSNFTYTELEELINKANNTVLKGWFELARTSKTYQGTLESQSAAIGAWIAANPNHPASQQLPSDLTLLQHLIQSRPNNIALFLPLEGKLAKAGKAIQDGFLAAYYRSHNEFQQPQIPVIKLYDTSSKDINTLYDEAVFNGAEIIIGPLEKTKVQKLQQRQDLPITTLALNYSETIHYDETRPFYQFGLSLEDETIQVADRAWLEGHRQALIISSDTKWGQRTARAFIQRWQKYEGTIVTHSHLDNTSSYSETIENILHIDQSKRRAFQLRKLFGRPFEFEARRRSDIDMIFLVVHSREGQQIKPTLNFYYAGNIPVYATSQIYSSTNTIDKNRDLNKIRLTTPPWTLNQSVDEKKLIEQYLKIKPGYERLYALGVDSFLLYPRLKQLYQMKEQQLYGATGKLSIAPNKHVLRKQLWAEIHKGELRPLRTLTLSNDNTL
ncbi:hypothetical protein AB835_01350 [Candidatus Endobugula sertula]|uniref:Penicillin-binding protein activator n=1 Tax=Candidatus Endobugula sertula TaxID=62101 RepID=A0A1D2QTN1_9GAMM|nr:hypothetical protein AB835_01350 [Candidatus Endobugula sertula]